MHLPFGGARGDETASTSTWGRDGGGVGDEDDAETREFPSLFGFSGLFGVPRGAVSRWDSKPTPLRGLTEEQVPRHVAVIMDGNSRWAERRRLPRTIGHERGVNALRGAVKCCASWGVRTLTVFAFSEENWGRNQMEVEELMALVETTMRDELPLLVKEGVRVEVIGDLRKVNVGVREAVTHAVEATKENDALRLVIALSYGGRQDIVQAARALARKVAAGEIHPDDIDEDAISAHLSTHDAIAAVREGRDSCAPLRAPRNRRNARNHVKTTQVAALEAKWQEPRWKGVERPYSAQDVVAMRGTLQGEAPYQDATAQKLFETLDLCANTGGHSRTYGALDPVQAATMAPKLTSIYVSGWQCSSTSSSSGVRSGLNETLIGGKQPAIITSLPLLFIASSAKTRAVSLNFLKSKLESFSLRMSGVA